jgi:SAM-dependent methyltransferase
VAYNAGSVSGWEQRQASHYDQIAADYEVHYSDEWSQRYRRRFFNERLVEGVPLEGARVLDAMCGSGQLAEFLASRGALVTGLDVSQEVVDRFRKRLPGSEGVARSITDSGFPDGHFDAVMVVGGLHHVHPDVDRAVAEVHRILRPGGHFCFAEPHVGSLADLGRRLWYRFDPLFEDNEAGIDVECMRREHAGRFEFLRTRYGGGPAYLLVFNSMVFRVPVGLKRVFSPPLLWLEGAIERVQTRRTSCMVLCQWRKPPAEAIPGDAGAAISTG